MQNNQTTAATPVGVLMINIGTPASPSVPDVRHYLREFLSDPRVLSMPAVIRWLFLNLYILPFRPRRSAGAYAKIWLEEGSPLLVHGLALRDSVEAELGDAFHVELAMRYLNPDIGSALERMQREGIRRIVVIPLFPQYSEAATGSALARVKEEAARLGSPFELCSLVNFYAEPSFIEAQADTIRPYLSEQIYDHVLFSYHGLPESQIRSIPGCLTSENCCDPPAGGNERCYRAQCFATTAALVQTLDLEPGSYSSSFQSRLWSKWITPHTDKILPELRERGVNDLLVSCPAFTTDCLETLEEVGIRLRDQWQAIGGHSLGLAPCVNASPIFTRAVSDWARAQGQSHDPAENLPEAGFVTTESGT